MVDGKTILDELQRRGVEVRADGDELVLGVKAQALQAWRIDRIQSQRGGVLLRLRRVDQSEASSNAAAHGQPPTSTPTPTPAPASNRDAYAICDSEAAQGKPVFAADDDPLDWPETADAAAMDLLILSYACGRRARRLYELGPCPQTLAGQILTNLAAVDMAIGA